MITLRPSTCPKMHNFNQLTRRMPEIDDQSNDHNRKCGEIEPERGKMLHRSLETVANIRENHSRIGINLKVHSQQRTLLDRTPRTDQESIKITGEQTDVVKCRRSGAVQHRSSGIQNEHG